jgi:protein subunit release factor A
MGNATCQLTVGKMAASEGTQHVETKEVVGLPRVPTGLASMTISTDSQPNNSELALSILPPPLLPSPTNHHSGDEGNDAAEHVSYSTNATRNHEHENKFEPFTPNPPAQQQPYISIISLHIRYL